MGKTKVRFLGKKEETSSTHECMNTTKDIRIITRAPRPWRGPTVSVCVNWFGDYEKFFRFAQFFSVVVRMSNFSFSKLVC